MLNYKQANICYKRQILKQYGVKQEFSMPRRTEICHQDSDLDDEDLIQREEMVVTVTRKGYIKRVPLSLYRSQARGGKGRSGMTIRDEDFVTSLFIASTSSDPSVPVPPCAISL